MGDYSVEGGELKRMLKLAKEGPIAFGFNPGKSEDDAYCGMHRNKPPATIGKEAKESGDGSKFAFGTAEVVGKECRLTCLKELPGLAKRFKKYLKTQKVMLNVVILDAEGNVLESDVEEGLPDDPDLADDGTAAPAAPAAPTDEPVDQTGPLLKRLGVLRGLIAALPPESAQRVLGPFKQLVELVKGGETDRAVDGIGRVEAAVAMLAKQAAAPVAPPAAPSAAPATPTPPGAPPSAAPAPPAPADTQLQKLAQMAAVMRTKGEALAEERARTMVLAAVDKVDGHIKAAEAEPAIALLKKLQDIIKTLPVAAPGTPASPQSPAAPTEPQENPGEAEWTRRYGAIEGQITAAITGGLVPDVDGLRTLRDYATGLAIDGAFDKALAMLPRLEDMLATAPDDGTTAFEKEVPPDAKPFAMARLQWAGTRSRMKGEIMRLTAMIEAEAAGDDLLATAAANAPSLSRQVDMLDARLEEALDSIVNAEVSVRGPLKDTARNLIKEYEGVLANPFFADVDQSNGFGSFAITSAARSALADITAVLA